MNRPSQAVLGAPLIYVYAAVVGVLGALCAFGFQELVDAIQHLTMGRGGSILQAAHHLSTLQRLLIPTVGGIVCALIVRFFVHRSSPFGVADMMEVVSLRKGRLRFRATIARCLSSASVIATGGSVGREGPIIQLGATLASRVAKWTRVGPRRQAVLLGCGVSAGMAAAYNAPLAGAFFVMEVILANFAMDVFAPVMVSSIVSTLIMREFRGGDVAIYDIPTDLHFIGLLPIVAAIALGIPGGAVAVLFQRLLKLVDRAFARLVLPIEAKAGLGGLIIGAIGIGFPEVWGNGYNATSQMLSGGIPMLSVVALFLLKPLATSVTVGSGGSGGVFTPTLFVGAALGTAFGFGFNALFPEMGVPAAAFAVMGMAAMIAGTTQAPIMSMLLLFEMTHSQTLLLPLILATTASTVTARMLGRDSIYTERLRSRGVPVDAGIEELILHKTRVRDIMRGEHARVPVDTTLDQILQVFQESRRDVIYVTGERKALVGLVSLHDVKPFLNKGDLGPVVTAMDVMQPPISVDPDASIAEVIDRFDAPDLEELPVTKLRDEFAVLVGRITRRDLIACLNLEVLKRQSLRAKFVTQDEREPSYVELPRGYSLARIPIPPHLAGRTIAKSGLREEANLTILTLIQTSQGGVEHRVIPDPEVVLDENQALVVLGQTEAIKAFRENARRQE